MRLFFAVITLSLALALPKSTPAAEPTPPLWHKNCGKDKTGKASCFIEQFALTMPQRAVVLHIRFSLTEQKEQARMVVTTPLGVLLIAGVTLSVDGSAPIALPFDRCTQQGCETSAVLDKLALEKFAKGKILIVRYAATSQGATDIPIKLEGLAEALTSLSK